MKHISLFSGIGGFDLAAEWMGWENVAHCEWNDFGKRILKYYWPNAISYDDITKTDFNIHRGTVDIVTGGFPCQPYSTAGKRKGKDDERHLWPEMLRAIREIQPRWVVGENVRGLTNWNGGLVFDEVQADLEALGYEVTPFLLPACAVNAPHRRERIWFVAHKNTNRNGWGSHEREKESCFGEFRDVGSGDNERIPSDNAISGFVAHAHGNTERPPGKGGETESNRSENYDEPCDGGEQAEQHTGCGAVLRHASNNNNNNKRLQGCKDKGSFGESREKRNEQLTGLFRTNWEEFPTQSPVCDGDDGFPAGLDGITFPKWRNESIKGGGNAIVPQVVLQIFKAIEQFDKLK